MAVTDLLRIDTIRRLRTTRSLRRPRQQGGPVRNALQRVDRRLAKLQFPVALVVRLELLLSGLAVGAVLFVFLPELLVMAAAAFVVTTLLRRPRRARRDRGGAGGH
jgi:hypothetical protein